MRPHSVAIIAAFLYFLKKNHSKKNFLITLETVVGGRKKYPQYEVTIQDYQLDHKSTDFQPISITFQIGKAWSCKGKVTLENANKQEYKIEHEHSLSVPEYFRLYTNSIEGDYNSRHGTYKTFESKYTNDPECLEFTSDTYGVYKISNI